ncbi:hypothetical protein T492DRAFT_891012, partial [Pavlovales sp. CCMP2436]
KAWRAEVAAAARQGVAEREMRTDLSAQDGDGRAPSLAARYGPQTTGVPAMPGGGAAGGAAGAGGKAAKPGRGGRGRGGGKRAADSGAEGNAAPAKRGRGKGAKVASGGVLIPPRVPFSATAPGEAEVALAAAVAVGADEATEAGAVQPPADMSAAHKLPARGKEDMGSPAHTSLALTPSSFLPPPPSSSFPPPPFPSFPPPLSSSLALAAAAALPAAAMLR